MTFSDHLSQMTAGMVFNSEPGPADEIVSWVVTKGLCGLIMSFEMVYDPSHHTTHTLSAESTLAVTHVNT